MWLLMLIIIASFVLTEVMLMIVYAAMCIKENREQERIENESAKTKRNRSKGRRNKD